MVPIATLVIASLVLMSTPVSAHHEEQVPWLVCAAHPRCDPAGNPAVEPTIHYANSMGGVALCLIKYPFTCDPFLLGSTLEYLDEML